MEGVIKKSRVWATALLIGFCAIALALGAVHQANARSTAQPGAAGSPAGAMLEKVSPANVSGEPVGVQGEYQTGEAAQPGIWFGLAASLSGTLVLGVSFLMLQRQAA